MHAGTHRAAAAATAATATAGSGLTGATLVTDTTGRLNCGHCGRLPTRNMSDKLMDMEESVTHTGPKGVINDWRRFKLESMDQDNLPSAKKELLRQMSSPHKTGDDSRGNLNRKVSVQEYELLKEDDEGCLKKYRRRCMQEMHEKLSFGPKFEGVHDLDSGEAFLEVIEKEHHSTVVVVHIYKIGVKGCEELNNCLDCLVPEYPTVKFCRINAVTSGAAERFRDEVLPTLLVYKAGELLGNFLACTQHLSEEFFATDVEAFLNSYGLLPEKEGPDMGDEEENDVE